MQSTKTPIKISVLVILLTISCLQLVSSIDFAWAIDTDTKKEKQIIKIDSKKNDDDKVDDSITIELKTINKANSLLKKGDTEAAIYLYQEVINEVPDNAGIRQRLAKAFYRNGAVDDAIKEMEIAVRLKPSVAIYQAELAWLYTKVNRLQGAMRHAKIASELAPKIASPYVILGYCYGSSNKSKLAYGALNKAISIDPDNIIAYLYLAEVYQDDEKLELSIKTYEKALKLDPKNVQGMLGIASVYGLSGNKDMEKTYYDKVVSLYPNDPDVLGRYGWYLSSKGDIGNSLKYGMKTTMVRLNQSWDKFMGMFIAVWAGIFMVFGLIFSAIALGANFKAQPGENVIRSFFLIMYKDKPGRLVITSRRIVFVPELISRSFGATRVSIEREQVASIDSEESKSSSKLVLKSTSGVDYIFKVPVMIQNPLLKLLEAEGLPFGQNSLDDQSSVNKKTKVNKSVTKDTATEEEKEEEIVATSLDFRPENDSLQPEESSQQDK